MSNYRLNSLKQSQDSTTRDYSQKGLEKSQSQVNITNTNSKQQSTISNELFKRNTV